MIADSLFRNPRLLSLTVCVLLIAGWGSLVVMPRLEDPVLRRRVGIVGVVMPGAAALQIEGLVAEVLEAELLGIAQIKQVRSNCQTGGCQVAIELRLPLFFFRGSHLIERSGPSLPILLDFLASLPAFLVTCTNRS